MTPLTFSQQFTALLRVIRLAATTAVLLPDAVLFGVASRTEIADQWHVDCPEVEATVSNAMTDLVLANGYQLEEHFVATPDGYILGVFRIPVGRVQTPAPFERFDSMDKSRSRRNGRPVVLLQHGLLDSSASWVINGPKESLGFLLADRGFDVWLANSRGNTFSKRHENLTVCSREFWEFSHDEMASYDLPATVNYILEATGAEKIGFVGHSQGTTIAFAAFSSDKTLADHISIAVMLAPVAFATHITSKIMKWLARLDVATFVKELGVNDFLPAVSIESELFGRFCKEVPQPCLNILSMIAGYNPSNINTTRWPVYLAYSPAGTSVQNMMHWTQAVRLKDENRLQEFDFGQQCHKEFIFRKACNQHRYGSKMPPAYNISSVSVPVALFTGGQDVVADTVDSELLAAALPDNIIIFKKEEPTYEHLDFTWGMNAHQLIYPYVMQILGDWVEPSTAIRITK